MSRIASPNMPGTLNTLAYPLTLLLLSTLIRFRCCQRFIDGCVRCVYGAVQKRAPQ